MNDISVGNPPPTPPVGEYRLFDRVLGPLTAGKYKLEIEQTVGAEEGTVSRYFNVTGPRWGLEATEVHAVYPREMSKTLRRTVMFHLSRYKGVFTMGEGLASRW